LQQIKSQFYKSLEGQYQPQEIAILYKLLLEFITQKNIHQVFEITATERETFSDYTSQLKSGIPIQYILGQADFYQLKFKVNQHVLIPRPETEELVYLILEDAKIKHPNSIIDIGTGSGCIPIALKKNLPSTKISALDVSEDALKIAKENAVLNQVAIDFILDDALKLDAQNYPKYDVIVSNPPYIALSEKKIMDATVINHEPHLALFVPDDEVLIFYDRIANFATTNLEPDGFLYFEINQALAKETSQILENKGFKTQIIKDINQNDRIIKAQLLG
jgi:release factor glutamine methyltransferase